MLALEPHENHLRVKAGIFELVIHSAGHETAGNVQMKESVQHCKKNVNCACFKNAHFGSKMQYESGAQNEKNWNCGRALGFECSYELKKPRPTSC